MQYVIFKDTNATTLAEKINTFFGEVGTGKVKVWHVITHNSYATEGEYVETFTLKVVEE